MDEFPSNSRTPKPATRVEFNPTTKPETDNKERVYEPVITGSVTIKKKSLGRRFLATFFAKDSGSVVSYVAHEVLLPTLRDLFINAVTSSVERAVYGDRTPPARPSSYRGATSTYGRPTVSYNQVARPPVPARQPVTQPSSVDIGLIVFASKDDADMVANRLFDEVRQFGCATVAALFGFMNQSSTYMDNRFGWDDLAAMHVVRHDGGWLLDLPRPVDLQQ